MRLKTMLAILLIALGILVFAREGINYTSRDRVVDIGSMHITAEKSHHIPLPPVAGGIALAAGVLLLVVDMKKILPMRARS